MIDLDALEAAAVRRLRGSITRHANRHLASMGIVAGKSKAKGIVTRRANPEGMSGEAIEPGSRLAGNLPISSETGAI